MVVSFEKGKKLEYISMKDFSLNFEDRSIKSVKVKVGESVFYDGDTAYYKKVSGEQVTGRCPSLISAINVMNWLVLKNGEVEAINNVSEKKIPSKPAVNTDDYDGLRGGSFDSYAANNNGDIHVSSFNPRVIKEENLVIKSTQFENKEKPESVSTLDITGDHIEVKAGFVVNSSTSIKKDVKRDLKVEQRDEMGSEATTTINGIKALPVKQERKSFIIDDKTPLTIREDMTKVEVEKFKGASSTENQEAKIVSPIKIPPMEIQDTDGVTLKKKKTKTVEGINITTSTQSEKEMVVNVSVSSGSDSISPIEDASVVGKVKSSQEIDSDSDKKAKERAEARKKASKPFKM